jgi:L-iditol 2-dehydrogenase
MRSAVLLEPGEFRIERRDRPTPEADEVLVAVRDVGICGSDVHYYTHGRIGEYVVENPLVLGHESAGEVVDAGDDVEGIAAGDRVTMEPGVPCEECDHCRRGVYNRCPDVRFMATPPVDGAFTEYVAWPADYVYRLPEDVSTQAGALCEPLSVALHACRRGDIGPGDTIHVAGFGPIGALVTEVANLRGAADVLVSDVVPEKLDRASERGADATVDVRERDLAAAVREYTGDGADVFIEASGAPDSIAAAPTVVRPGGTVVLVGLPGEETVALDTTRVVDRELDLRGSFRFRHTYPAAVDALADGAVDVEGIIDFEAPLADIDGAFRRVRDRAEVIKGMVSL